MDQHIDTGIISHLYAFLRKGDINVCFVFHGKSKHLKIQFKFYPTTEKYSENIDFSELKSD